MRCDDCGLFDSLGEKCAKYGTRLDESRSGGNCPYFNRIIIENGERLSPGAHLLMKEDEIRARRKIYRPV